jgi:hypothetical protein
MPPHVAMYPNSCKRCCLHIHSKILLPGDQKLAASTLELHSTTCITVCVKLTIQLYNLAWQLFILKQMEQ